MDEIPVPEHHLKVQFSDLTPYHQSKIIERGRAWKSQHRHKILELLKGLGMFTSTAPRGSNIFDPCKWAGVNWLWFEAMTNRHYSPLK